MEQPTMSESGSSWGAESRTVESSAVAAELQNLDEEIRMEFGGDAAAEEEGDDDPRDSLPEKQADNRVDSVPAPLSPYKGNVETRVLQADAELRSVLAKVTESKNVLAEVQRAAAAAQEKSDASAAELEHVVGVISEVLQKIAEQDASRADLTPEVRAQIQQAISEPVQNFFIEDGDPVSYIDEKIANMTAILNEWPDIDLDSDEHREAQALASNTLSFLSQMSEDDALAAMTDAQAEPTKDHKINTYEGVYRLHIVSEPPEEVTSATRTAGIEFDNGEFFMLGIYHSYDGQRPVHETKSCHGRRVRVFAGEKYSLTPAKDEDDLLSILTPYISNVSGIELV